MNERTILSSGQLALSLNREIFIDNFAGGGGASTGVERALGRPVDHALNHDRKALAMHRMNHPTTKHHREDIRHADPLKIAGDRPVGGIWFSPDCKHFSKAKGGKPRSKHIRGLAWSVVHWVNVLRRRVVGGPRVIYLENVEEFLGWCPLQPDGCPRTWRKGWFFQCFVGALRRRGYDVEWRELRACAYGAPTIRKRLFLIARCDGAPIVWPVVSHVAPDAVTKGTKPFRTMAECIDFTLPCPSIFLTRAESRVAKCVRPLATSTLARVAKGVDRYVLRAKKPFIVELTHQGNAGVASVDEPLKTITAANRGEKGLIVPIIAHAQQGGAVRPADAPIHTIAASTKDQNQVIVPILAGCGGRAGQSRPRPMDEPGATSTSKADTCVAAVHLTKFNTGSVGSAVDQPAPTVTANSFIKRAGGSAPIGVVAAYIAQHNGGTNGHQTVGHPATAPASTISSKGCQQQLVAASLTKYYGTDQDPRLEEPSHTVTTKDRFGLTAALLFPPPLTRELELGARRVASFLRSHGVQFEGEFATVGEYVIVDIGMRMLKPRELYRAQGFPGSYIIDRGLDEADDGRFFEVALTGTEQVRMCGNSVCPPMSEALVAANSTEKQTQRRAA